MHRKRDLSIKIVRVKDTIMEIKEFGFEMVIGPKTNGFIKKVKDPTE